MKIPKQVVETVEAKSIKVFAKLRDSGSYELMGMDGKSIKLESDGYVPTWFPGGDSDYLDLDIDLETGVVLNWKKPAPEEVAKTFCLIPFESE